MRDPRQAIRAIENNLSGRRVGDSATELGLARIADPEYPSVIQNYPNQFPDGLGAATDNNGLGGGRLGDVLTDDLFGIYYEYGPASPSLLIDLAAWYSGFDSSRIREVAGPSGVGWPNGPEERPVNDMDYDFDVPLPAPPEGATSVQEKSNLVFMLAGI